MPLALVHYKPDLPSALVQAITSGLPREIADALHVAGDNLEAHLSPQDIEVIALPVGKFDVTRCDIGIIVFANDFSERRATLEMRKERVVAGVRRILSERDSVEVKSFVWVRLGPGASGEC